MTSLTVLLGDYPHTRALKSGEIAVDGVRCEFPDVSPVHNAFGRMMRDLEFDVCEMAILAFLQAREAGVPVRLLPLVMAGDVHHGSLSRWAEAEPVSPGDLKGRRVAVRAYSQTTGLWVRGILREEYGVESRDVTWVTTEEPHVAQYREPSYVERADGSIWELLGQGDVSAAIVSSSASSGATVDLVPLIADAENAGEAWLKRHDVLPVNHMVVARADLVEQRPDDLQAVYEAIKAGIDATSTECSRSPRGRAVTAGWSQRLANSVALAGLYGLEQELLRYPLDSAELVRESGVVTA
jgi:4,5-dihydroxyphthalate decarboxylase